MKAAPDRYHRVHFVTLPEAARWLGVSLEEVYRLIGAGELSARTYEGVLKVSEPSVIRYITEVQLGPGLVSGGARRGEILPAP